MKTSSFFFDLPEHLIAQTPAQRRSLSRLMVIDRAAETISHDTVDNLHEYIPAESIFVINNSKVRKARVYAKLESGIEVELLFLEDIDRFTWTAMAKKSKRLKPGRTLLLPGGITATVSAARTDGIRELTLSEELEESFFQNYGHVPLPPYIQRDDTFEDEQRYQTIYAEKSGSVAAPTAGLHLSEEILDALRRKGVTIAPITLHVGTGTFLPIRTEEISDHSMHFERYEIDSAAESVINRAMASGQPITAVGTTSVRTLEASVLETGRLKSGNYRTNLYIKPGFNFRCVSHLMTNFHTPGSTLLVLVAAFAGYDLIMRAYREAVEQQYRFFSYGDSMLII